MESIKDRCKFVVDKSKCIKCGKCINVCSGMVLQFGKDGYPEMKDFERFGWRGCWRCEHCLAVCPEGAISIFGKKPEDSLPPPNDDGMDDNNRPAQRDAVVNAWLAQQRAKER